jgi:hypothetical protein
MGKRNIIIIIIITIVLITAAVTIIYTKPDIVNLYLCSDKNLLSDVQNQNDIYYFKSTQADIYLVIEVKNIKTDDEIKAMWRKIDDDFSEIIQKNIVYPEKKGSGRIIISLAKRDDRYSPGFYSVEVYLNGYMDATKDFFVSE